MKEYYVPVEGKQRLMFVSALVGLGYSNFESKTPDAIIDSLKEYHVLVVDRHDKHIGANYKLYSGNVPSSPEDVIADLMTPSVEVKLNREYTAVISADKKAVTVGCQTFNRDVIK